jgi:heme/copper-type cytochrome/quinol oxidase subunit 2
VLPIFGAIALCLLLSGTAWACPSCNEALASADGSQAGMVTGYFWSILFMMSMPFLILGGMAGCFYIAIRRARAVQKMPLEQREERLLSSPKELAEV